MSELPEDVKRQATQIFADSDLVETVPEAVEIIARAIMAERYRCANVGYRVCAETRHVKLGMQVKEAIRRGN